MDLRMSFLQLLVAVVVSWALFLVTMRYFWTIPTDHSPNDYHMEGANDAFRDPRLSLASADEPRGPDIPIYIVEEHHEVLVPWYQAARDGLIPVTGNTIFHIDGHPDNALPPYKDVLPFKEMPTTAEMIHKMMQKNDMFIVAAALSGLLSRYIWVIPPWEPSNMLKPGVSHKRWVLHMGRTLTPHLNRHEQLFRFPCVCISQESDEAPVCFWEEDYGEHSGRLYQIAPSECPREMTAVGELVTEEKALELLAAGGWLAANESVILDIDEDYYGVEPAGTPAYKVGVSEESMEELSAYVSGLFCPASTKQERQADDFFFYLTQQMKDLQRSCVAAKNGTCRLEDYFVFFDKDVIEGMRQEMSKRGMEELLCEEAHDRRGRLILKKLMLLLSAFTSEQLEALAEVGLCLDASPKSVAFNASFGAYVCQGRNTPKESATPFHLPTPHELLVRSQRLEQLVKWGEKPRPRLVTVCRSSRDGFTPRASVPIIETSILAILYSHLGPEASPNTLHYDSDLFGGIFGWYGRHKGLVGDTMKRNDEDSSNKTDHEDNDDDGGGGDKAHRKP